MTDDQRSAWIETVWSVLKTIPVGSSIAQVEAKWRHHRQRQRPVVTIYGAYDAGKSSLLKRLLFEDGVDIPDWLTISGRRETFVAGEIEGPLWTYRDSPGLAGGNETHDLEALDSLDLTDLLIWALPPQLVTSEKETFSSIANGTRFGVQPCHVADGLMAVILRIDEAGIDAVSNQIGFTQLSDRKRNELMMLLDDIGAVAPRWGIFPISADPYQGVGNNTPDAESYAMGDGWDGVAELRAALQNAFRNADELRILAGFRYASMAVAELVRSVQCERNERDDALQTCAGELERLKLWSINLDNFHDKWKAELHRIIEDELLSASRRGTGAATTLHEKLSAAIDRWSDQASAAFEQLTLSAQLELGQRARSPSMERLKQLILELTNIEDTPPKSELGKKVFERMGRLGGAFRESFKAYAHFDLGVSLQDAAKHIKEYENSGKTWAEYLQDLGKKKPFVNEEAALKASEYVKWGQAMGTIGPIVTQLGGALYEIGGDILSQREANNRAKLREDLRNALRTAVMEVEAEALTSFNEMTSSFLALINKQSAMQIAAKSAFEAQITALEGYSDTLDTLMRDRPV